MLNDINTMWMSPLITSIAKGVSLLRDSGITLMVRYLIDYTS